MRTQATIEIRDPDFASVVGKDVTVERIAAGSSSPKGPCGPSPLRPVACSQSLRKLLAPSAALHLRRCRRGDLLHRPNLRAHEGFRRTAALRLDFRAAVAFVVSHGGLRPTKDRT